MIKQETIDKIMSAANIVDVIGDFVSLKKAGVNYKGCCPFHVENTPSFVVSPVKGIYSCFGCGKKGNVVEFIKEKEALSYPEAIKWLASKYKIEVIIEYKNPEDKLKADKRDQLKYVNEWAVQYFQSEIKTPAAEKYIVNRKVSSEIIEKFRLGFAPSGWNGLLTCARVKQFNDEILFEASLISKNEKNSFDWFRNRIMFPFMDLSGNIIGFTGRIIEKTEKDAKYLNSKDTPLFSKGKTLFGIFQAKKAIVKNNECYLVEGNFDVTSFHQAGIENTVCGSGTAFTVEQIRLIAGFTNNITIIYDSDPAGIKASFKSIDLMLSEGINVFAISLPEGEDPDSFANKVTPKELAQYLEDNRKDFITFKHNILKGDIKKDPVKEAELINELISSIAIIPDNIKREIYKKQCINIFKIDAKVVDQALLKIERPQKIEITTNGWQGLEWAADAIKKTNKVFITSEKEVMFSYWNKDLLNTITFSGFINQSHIQELNTLTHNVFILDNVDSFYDALENIPEIIELCKKLYEFHLNVKVNPLDDLISQEVISFIEQYFFLANTALDHYKYDQILTNKIIEECAELFSKADNTTQSINLKVFASRLNLKESDFKKILKPYLDKRKSAQTLKTDVFDDDGENKQFSPDRLPDYVDRDLYQKWGYFPYENSKGQRVRYVFRTENGGLQVIGNFYIEPCFHVYDQDLNKNKRIIKVNNAEQNTSHYMEMNSSAMIEFAQFKKMLFNEGGNIFTKGKANHHEVILASISNCFPKCYEFNIFGQQHEGFWAFANAIFVNGEIIYTDELGLVSFEDKTYYSPSFSKIHSSNRKDNDKYELDRHFKYMETNKTNFEEWTTLMNDVYRFNDNGKWATLMALMSAFRSDIYSIDRLFTALFIIGPTESGKTQIAVSIRSLFMSYEAPLFNLNSATDASLFTNLERYRDVPFICEEYNDNEISDIKFQGLKAAVYDGEGKQKRKDATSKDLDISKVYAAPIILGQEGPERDDGSLANRCVILLVPKKDDWTEEESNRFRLLKEKEKAGLSNVLLNVINQRNIVSANFQTIQRGVFKDLKNELNRTGSAYQTRILNTISLFVSMCKLWETKVPEFKLPFTYNEFFEIAKAKIIAQSEAITTTNRVSVFFDTLELLLNRPYNGLTPGKEYKIEYQKSITIQKSRTESGEFDLGNGCKIIYLRLNILHPMYSEVRKTEALKLNNLTNYLKDHPSYIGPIKSTRFEWTEIGDVADFDGKVTKIGRSVGVNTSAIAFRYDLLEIDLEKYTEPNHAKIEYIEQQQKLNMEGPAKDVPF